MEDGKRSSNAITSCHWSKRSWGSGSMNTEIFKDDIWIGLVRYDPITEKKEVGVQNTNALYKDFKYPGMNINEKFFLIESGEMRVIDPSYSVDGWCGQKEKYDVKNGKWYYSLEKQYDRPGQVIVYHEDYKDSEFANDFEIPDTELLYGYNEGHDKNKLPEGYSEKPIFKNWRKVWRGIGVDTARIVLVDAKYFKNDEVCPDPKSLQVGWYKQFNADPNSHGDNNWDLMIEKFEKMFGWSHYLIPFGFLSLSGWGDGCYQSLVQVDEKLSKVVAMRVVFIVPEKNDEKN